MGFLGIRAGIVHQSDCIEAGVWFPFECSFGVCWLGIAYDVA